MIALFLVLIVIGSAFVLYAEKSDGR